MDVGTWALKKMTDKVMRSRIKSLIRERKLSWAKLGELEGLTRGSLQAKVERWATKLNRFVDHMGYEVVFKKKDKS